MRTRLPCPDRVRVREALDYDATTGVFTWRNPSGTRAVVGEVAGGKDAYGSIKISLDSQLYMAHYLAWLHVYGEWPRVVKHRNGLKGDNRLANLFTTDGGAEFDLERLKTLLDYDPATGVFTWKIATSSRNPVGSQAGTVLLTGYRYIAVDGRRSTAHRLAWFYVNGEWPSADLDHVNLNRDDNHIANLRLANRSQNMANGSVRRDNTSGCRGVYWNKQSQKWRVAVQKDGKQIQIGMFAVYDDAVRASIDARKKLHGEFAGSEGTSDMTLKESGGG